MNYSFINFGGNTILGDDCPNHDFLAFHGDDNKSQIYV